MHLYYASLAGNKAYFVSQPLDTGSRPFMSSYVFESIQLLVKLQKIVVHSTEKSEAAVAYKQHSGELMSYQAEMPPRLLTMCFRGRGSKQSHANAFIMKVKKRDLEHCILRKRSEVWSHTLMLRKRAGK